jgi:UDP-glucose 6-dehydrogenase
MRISIVGTGYVGLVSGTCLASQGHDVICVDIKPAVVDRINAGRSPIYEHGLDPLLANAVSNGTLRATMDLAVPSRRLRSPSSALELRPWDRRWT